jgi:hypothetical protein
MRPVTLSIPGEYWDSQLYRGKLFLFTRDGRIRTIDWDRLIDSFRLNRNLQLAAQCAFQRSDYLYGSKWEMFFSDPEIKALVTEKFKNLGKLNLSATEAQLKKSEYGHQDNPFSFPHADTLIYFRKMYVVGDGGVWRATCDPRRTRNPISSRNGGTRRRSPPQQLMVH